jgi:23S rRNA pseudouridine1911/1915/1917 synthase
VGAPRDRRGRIEAPIGRDPRSRTRFAVVADGKPAVTRYATLATGTAPDLPPGAGTVTLLACTLETGRTHQIRVHLSRLGTPVVGDPVYGPRPAVAAACGLERPFLHATELSFTHPVTGRTVTVVEPLPDDLAAALRVVAIALPTGVADATGPAGPPPG